MNFSSDPFERKRRKIKKISRSLIHRILFAIRPNLTFFFFNRPSRSRKKSWIVGREDRRLDIKGAYRCVTVRQCVECVSCEESISRNELPSIFETYPTYRVSYKRCHRGVRMPVPRAKTTCPRRKVARCYDWIRRAGVNPPIGRIRTRIQRSARPISSRRARSCWRPATSSASKKLPPFARRWIFGKTKQEHFFFFLKFFIIF